MPRKETDRGAQYLRLEGERSWVELLACWRQTKEELPSDPANSTGARRKWHSGPHCTFTLGWKLEIDMRKAHFSPPHPSRSPIRTRMDIRTMIALQVDTQGHTKCGGVLIEFEPRICQRDYEGGGGIRGRGENRHKGLGVTQQGTYRPLQDPAGQLLGRAHAWVEGKASRITEGAESHI